MEFHTLTKVKPLTAMKIIIHFWLLLTPYVLLAQPNVTDISLRPVVDYASNSVREIGTEQSVDFSGFRGIPDYLTEKVLCSARTIAGQVKYDEFLSGKISKTEWEAFQETHRINTGLLSPRPIKHRINTLVGFDQQGRRVVIVDANNNQDFSDDQVLYYRDNLPEIPRSANGSYRDDSMNAVYTTMPAVNVSLQTFDGQKTISRTLWIKPNPYRTGFIYSDTTLNRHHLSILDLESRKGTATILGESFDFVVNGGPTIGYTPESTIIYAYSRDATGSSTRLKGEYRLYQSMNVKGHRIQFTGISTLGDRLQVTDQGTAADLVLKQSK